MDNFVEAVRTLNTLQSNAATLQKSLQERDTRRHFQIPQTIQMAERAGVTLSDIDKLSIIHVSGTKGKGSTCAFCESILRQHGYKTGFFSSPHLVEVRERIRINGTPLSKEAFSTYFWDCYKNLDDTREAHGGEMPAYFRFLTIMAFHVFLQEQVDVAIMEVGIGGQYDCTNIIRTPVVVGVTSLGLDHTSILGNTIEKIAWQKAGIFKPGVPAVTAPQPIGALGVLKERAGEIGNPLFLTPNYDTYDWHHQQPKLGIAGEMQKVNASLAMQLCKTWLENHSIDIAGRQSLYLEEISNQQKESTILSAKEFEVSKEFVNGLQNCHWAGRTQKYHRPGVTFYLDGAHTDESVEQCSKWFKHAAAEEIQNKSGQTARILMFNINNVRGDRDPAVLLQHLKKCEFDCAVFCPHIISTSMDSLRQDQFNFNMTSESQSARSTQCKNSWLRVLSDSIKSSSPTSAGPTKSVTNYYTNTTNSTDYKSSAVEASPSKKAQFDTPLKQNLDEAVSLPQEPDTGDSHISLNSKLTYNPNIDSEQRFSMEMSEHSTPDTDLIMPCFVFSSIEETVQWINCVADPEKKKNLNLPIVLQEAEHLQVLCVGSLHLVGGVIGLLDPDIVNTPQSDSKELLCFNILK